MLDTFKGLSPLMRVVLVVGIPLFFLVVASNSGLAQNVVRILQSVPLIIYIPVYMTKKKPEEQIIVAATQQAEES